MSRKEEYDYENDVFYDVWRSGGNPDNLDMDRVNDDYLDGLDHEQSAKKHFERQKNNNRNY